jgi:hypothetical protein
MGDGGWGMKEKNVFRSPFSFSVLKVGEGERKEG